ncbi:hypothetical protein F5883DRAFT_198681 [Diaporthe sp. PMI_573]|nr:hypothetical protein F5883DRAFT_198681 [Diaporthaceae sp. PMI_573]
MSRLPPLFGPATKYDPWHVGSWNSSALNAWIILCGLLGLVVLTPEGNIAAIDAYFFGASASTESGLNTVDVKALRTYQQVFLYPPQRCPSRL